MNNAEFYDAQFYEYQWRGAYESAKQVVPLIVKMYGPKNVWDVGGGVGAWCKAFDEIGINAGCIDGAYVKHAQRICKNFIEWDIAESLPALPKADLALCLEVAEHLPETRAESFIAELCQIADTIVFSAAIPGQGGTNHINEQSHEYWHELFKQNGFKKEDVLRLAVAGCDNVEWWYKQNIFTYRKK